MRRAVGLEEGRNIAIRLARAAAALHRVGIIHRDIKPDNVMLEAGGSLKLLDLGVVRLPGLEDFPPEAIPGTTAYMAPEMFTGEAGNAATDIYALGVTLFRTFTGDLSLRQSGRDQRATPGAAEGSRHPSPGSAGLAAGRARPRDRARSRRAVCRHGGVRR